MGKHQWSKEQVQCAQGSEVWTFDPCCSSSTALIKKLVKFWAKVASVLWNTGNTLTNIYLSFSSPKLRKDEAEQSTQMPLLTTDQTLWNWVSLEAIEKERKVSKSLV